MLTAPPSSLLKSQFLETLPAGKKLETLGTSSHILPHFLFKIAKDNKLGYNKSAGSVTLTEPAELEGMAT